MHCLSIVQTSWIVCGSELVEVVEGIAKELADARIKIAFSGAPLASPLGPHVDADVAAQSSAPVPAAIQKRAVMTDIFGYIYTSGTTGLPKAAVIRHWRFFGYGAAATNTFLVRPTDRVYCALPLYHSAGGALGVGMMTYGGATFVIRRKFSASQCVRARAPPVLARWRRWWAVVAVVPGGRGGGRGGSCGGSCGGVRWQEQGAGGGRI